MAFTSVQSLQTPGNIENLKNCVHFDMSTKTLWEDTINKLDENGATLLEVVVGQSHDDLSPAPLSA